MKVTSAKFVKGIVDDDRVFIDGIPQIAFIGRSNVGKSSLLNALTNTKIARASSFPGRTQEINVFLVNDSFYFVDLPGYGFARISGRGKEKIIDLIEFYLFNESFSPHTIVFIIDATVGCTDKDISMLEELERHGKNFIVALSKIDKMTQSEYHHQMTDIKKMIGPHPIFPFSTKTMKGIDALRDTLFK